MTPLGAVAEVTKRKQPPGLGPGFRMDEACPSTLKVTQCMSQNCAQARLPITY